jgi:hypothetical protein
MVVHEMSPHQSRITHFCVGWAHTLFTGDCPDLSANINNDKNDGSASLVTVKASSSRNPHMTAHYDQSSLGVATCVAAIPRSSATDAKRNVYCPATMSVGSCHDN